MISQVKTEVNTFSQFLGIPLSNLPKFKIGDYVQHSYEFSEGKTVKQTGRITAVLIYEQEPNNPDSIATNYTYTVITSSHLWAIGQEDDGDESELQPIAV